jgi:hypothetical protein
VAGSERIDDSDTDRVALLYDQLLAGYRQAIRRRTKSPEVDIHTIGLRDEAVSDIERF